MESFENTKSSITGSALGSALSMTSSTSWSDIVTKIKGVSNQGAKTSSLNCGGSYTIPAGYHNGSGKITANSLSSQTSATASAGNILSGKTAYVNGSKITGTMANKGNLNWSGSNTTYTVPAGYYSGGTLNSKTSYTNGYNAGVTAADNRANTNSTNYKTGYNAGYSAGVSAKTSKSWTGHINTTSGGSFTTGFQPNVILLKRDGDNFPIGVYCSYGISVNHIEGPSNSHLPNIFGTNSNGFSLGTLNAYTKDKYCYCAAFKIV